MKLLILILTLFFQSNDSISPDEKYRIEVTAKELTDLNSELTYMLINQAELDTIVISKSLIHDMLPPNYYWTKDSKYLIYEDRREGEYKKIKVMALTTKDVILEVDGFINSKTKENYFDSDRNELYYISHVDRQSFELYSLDITSRSITVIKKFDNWDAYETPHIVNLDKANAKLTLQVINKDHRTDSIIIDLKTAR